MSNDEEYDWNVLHQSGTFGSSPHKVKMRCSTLRSSPVSPHSTNSLAICA